MKQTTTEIFIEVEEIICVKATRRKNLSDEEIKEIQAPVIEICPHCHRAIFEAETIEIEGDSNL
jgi:hypothetical protein